MSADIPLAALLGLADLAAVAAAAVGYALMRRAKPPGSLDAKEAYAVLDRAIQKYIPDLSVGYTWKEAFERLKESGVRADWDAMKNRLAEYEAFRYGGGEEPKGGHRDVISLASRLRSGVVGKGTKAKSGKPGQ